MVTVKIDEGHSDNMDSSCQETTLYHQIKTAIELYHSESMSLLELGQLSVLILHGTQSSVLN